MLKYSLVCDVKVYPGLVNNNFWLIWRIRCKVNAVVIENKFLARLQPLLHSAVHWFNCQFDVIDFRVNCFERIDFLTEVCDECVCRVWVNIN